MSKTGNTANGLFRQRYLLEKTPAEELRKMEALLDEGQQAILRRIVQNIDEKQHYPDGNYYLKIASDSGSLPSEMAETRASYNRLLLRLTEIGALLPESPDSPRITQLSNDPGSDYLRLGATELRRMSHIVGLKPPEIAFPELN